MNLSLERARTRRPVTWLTVLGVILLPVLIGGVLVAALYNPTERLNAMTAAIVNSDEPVTIDGQYTPLGRQLTAGLVKGSDQLDSNLNWVVSNPDDAAAGLKDGTYQAVVTIPSNFSAAATSSGQQLKGDGTAQQATIQVSTPPDAKIVDDAITTQITQTAASVLGQNLSSLTLENVFVGFSSLGTQLSQASDGATKLTDGARSAATGATSLADGIRQLGTGAAALGSGASGIAQGAGQLSTGAGSLAAGLTSGADTLQSGPQTTQLVTAAQGLAAAVQGTATATAGVSSGLDALVARCALSGAAPAFCDQLRAAATGASTAKDVAATANGIAPLVAGGVPQLAAGGAAGMRSAAQGATGLQSGATQLQSGANQLVTGANGLSAGATSAADGATSLSTGVGQVADGAASLASGLSQASASLPSYTDDQAKSLAQVVSDPVKAEGAGTSLFGASAVPLLAALALWIGGLATYLVLQSVTRRALTSRRTSIALALRGFVPGAAIGAVQGLLVAGVVQVAASYSWGDWLAFTGLAMLAGVAFAAVNQALVAVFRGVGRWVAALVAVLVIATGVVSTVPGWLTSIAGLMPTAPADQAMLGVLAGAGGVGSGVVGLCVWAVLAFLVTVLAVARHRTVPARTLLRTPAVPA